MTDDDYQDFAELWFATLEAYGREPSAMAVELTFNALQDFHLADVRAGISAHMRDTDEGKFPPKPAHIRRQIEGGSETRAHEAWEKLVHAVRRVGAWDSVVFDDGAIHAAIQTLWGGWPELCAQLTQDNESILRAQFIKHYQAVAGRAEGYPPVLYGHTDHQNLAQGFGAAEPPKLVGDREAAARIAGQTGGQQVAISDGSNVVPMPDKRLPGSSEARGGR